MLKRQSPTSTCIPLSSKRPRAAHGVSARGRLDLAANAIPSKPKRKRVTQKKKQPRTRVYDEINERTVLTTVPASDEDLSASDCDGIFLSPKWKPINRTPVATPIDEPNPGVRNEIRKQVSLLKNELLSDLVVKENEIQDQIRKSIKVLYHPLTSSSVTSIPPESWTLSQLARIPDGSPTRDFVPPWFASHSPSPCFGASSPANQAPSHTHHKTLDLLRDFTDEIKSEFKLVEDDNDGELWTDYLHKFIDRGLDIKKDDGIVDAEPDLKLRSGGLDDGSRDLAKTHSPTKIRASEWWDTASFNELVAKVYKLLLVAGDEIVA
ncbi:hypothetical protein V1520DRAFT_339431 [Lipomyces starkeyi]|uniref:Uncharacterized protein n=1 Tax=Lipomyces starkeyi NRRL Y-11557 TaxID=675824 RepID=A0A1E3PXP6_LIPST|nr:hypothetical protein LIPSTDRAFT_176498 [Lipomyces starkeyi NRRL Y-11557]